MKVSLLKGEESIRIGAIGGVKKRQRALIAMKAKTEHLFKKMKNSVTVDFC